MRDDFDRYIHEEGKEPRQWPRPLTWGALILLAWLLFEVTAQPAVGAFVICLKFGWGYFRTSLWLIRRDPNICRGLTCCALYVAAGSWKTTALAISAGVLLIVAGGLDNPGNQMLNHWLWGTLFAGTMGLGLSVLVSYATIVLSLCTKVKLWLHHDVVRSWREDHWPPRSRDGNKVGIVLLPASVLSVCLPFPALGERWFPGISPVAALFISLSVTAWIVLPLLLCRWIAAAAPEECWGSESAPQMFTTTTE